MDIDTIDMTPAERVQAVEDWIKQQPGQTVDFETRHHFGGGIYEREIFVPAGAVITGKVHLTEHLAKLTSGTMFIYSEDGHGNFTGPVTFASRPGVKRLGVAVTDCWFSNFHHVGDVRDIPEIEAMLVVDTLEQYRATLPESVRPNPIEHQED